MSGWRGPIVFLDIDGVLNSEDFYRRHDPIPSPPLDPVAIARLDRLCAASGAAVVLSTAWRGEPRLLGWLRERGFHGVIIGQTPRLGRVERGDEIAAWLNRHGPPDAPFVILDDWDDMGRLRPRLVQTDQLFGLQDRHVATALELIGGTA